MLIASSSNDHGLFEFSAAQPDSSDDFSERRPQCQTFIARFRWLLLRTKCGLVGVTLSAAGTSP